MALVNLLKNRLSPEEHEVRIQIKLIAFSSLLPKSSSLAV